MLLLPPCKINLGLFVTERRADGYHNLETVFYPVPLCDQLEVSVAPALQKPYALQVSGASGLCADEENLVVRVYRTLREEFSLPPVEIFLRKNIPSGAGLGGGSSDAASMMLLLNEMFELGLTSQQMRERVARFGADCAYFITPKPHFASGIGDVLMPLPEVSLRGYWLVLVKPENESVSTREAYASLTPKPAPCNLREVLVRTPIEAWRGAVGNDFEATVFAAHPRLAAIKQTLYDAGAVFSLMSGSGSTVYGIFKNEPQFTPERVFSGCFTWKKQIIA